MHPVAAANSCCKDTHWKFGTVTFCHLLSPFVSFCQFSVKPNFQALLKSRCKVTKKEFGIVTLQRMVSPYVIKCHPTINICFSIPLKLGIPCFVFCCKDTQWKFGTVHLCPFMSTYVHFCPFLSIYVHLRPNKTIAKSHCKDTQWKFGTVGICRSLSVFVSFCRFSADTYLIIS